MSWFISLIIAGSVFTSGNNIPTYEYQNTAVNDVNATVKTKGDETETFEKTYPFSSTGKIEVSNVNGSIYVEAWDRPEIQLTAKKVASTKERLSDVQIEINEEGSVFRARAIYKSWKNRSNGQNKTGYRNNGKLYVTFRLKVPRTAFLDEIETVNGSVQVSNMTNYTRVSAVNGSVKAANLRGTAKLSTVNGAVFADFDDLSASSTISLDTVNGRVKLSLPSNANATLKANTLNGKITNEFGLPIRKGKYVGRDLYGRIGSGDVKIRLSSVNGGLYINNKDGGTTNPATNLLKRKTSDDFDDSFETSVKVNTKDLNINIDKATKNAQKAEKIAQRNAARQSRNAQRAARRKIRRKARDKKREETRKRSEKLGEVLVDEDEIENAVREGLERAEGELASLSEARYLSSRSPYIQEKTGSIEVKGVPKVRINAEDCDVLVRGWEKNEVKYTISRITRTGVDREKPRTRISNNKSTVEIAVERRDPGSVRFNKDSIRLEVFVPKKSNLKVFSSREIRLEGVKGDLELIGQDESINIRDSYGNLKVKAEDGTVRVIGFSGSVKTYSVDGDVYLEGDFKRINTTSGDGKVYLTLSERADALITADRFGFKGTYKKGSTMNLGGLDLVKENENSWRVGEGKSEYNFGFGDGSLIVRSQNSLNDF